MHITFLRLLNIGRHADLSVRFEIGLCGIIGPNGSGKSTILSMIFAALSNIWTRTGGLKEDNLRATASAGEESSVTLGFEHNGTSMEIYRRLRRGAGRSTRADHELLVDNKTITGEKDVKFELEHRLGSTTKLWDSHVFVEQNSMFSFLTQTPGERASVYQTLCNTGKAEVICKAIDTVLAQNTSMLAEIVDNSADLNLQIGQNRKEWSEAKALHTAAKAKCLPAAEVARLKDITFKHRLHGELAEQFDEALTKMTADEELLDAAEVAKLAKEGAVAPAELVVKEQHAAYLKAEATLTAIARYKSVQRQIEAKQGALDLAEKAMEALLPVPPLHPADASRDATFSDLATAKGTIAKCNEIIQQFESTGEMVCPTCGMSGPNLEAHLEHVRADHAAATKIVTAAQRLVDAIDLSRRNRATIEQKHLAAERTLAIARQAMIGINTVPKPTETEAECQAVIATRNALVKELERATADAARVREAWASATSALASSVEAVEQLRARRDAAFIPDDVFASASKSLTSHDVAQRDAAVAAAKMEAATRAINLVEKELAALQTRIDLQRKARAFVDRMNIVKQVMHRQALPQVVAQANLQAMEADINKRLELFGSPFWVEVAEDLDFTVHFPGEPPRSARRLSDGQKTIFAWSFRSAMAALFGADLGLLALDEPSQSLDTFNQRCLAEALKQYAVQIRGRRQVILVSHHIELQTSFDQCIELQ
jgi:DNA repair exonuclease SbcCD ATPase subunit